MAGEVVCESQPTNDAVGYIDGLSTCPPFTAATGEQFLFMATSGNSGGLDEATAHMGVMTYLYLVGVIAA